MTPLMKVRRETFVGVSAVIVLSSMDRPPQLKEAYGRWRGRQKVTPSRSEGNGNFAGLRSGLPKAMASRPGAGRFAGKMRRRVELAPSRDASRAYPRVRGGFCHLDGGLWCATPGTRPEGGRRLEAARFVVRPRECPDRIVRGADGVASAALAHDSRGSQGRGQVQADLAERHQRSRSAGACRRKGARRRNSLRG